MFSKIHYKALGRKKILAAAIPLIMAAQAQGIEFYAGDVEANLTTQLNLGSSWRLEKQDQILLSDPNINNGNRNYQKDDVFSQAFEGRNDLQVTYENFGAIVSAKYWYDATLENDDALDDSTYDDLAKFSGARLMDAYVFAEFDILDMPVDVRIGKQVVSWGDSTFIPGGINSINPYDLSAFSRPGAKLKDAVIPVSMAFANISLTDNLSAEAFYQLEFQETVLEGCGTYFSQNDNFGYGCDGVEVLDSKAILTEAFGDEATAVGTLAALGLSDKTFLNQDANNVITRPDSDGQFGIALRFVSEALDTEFGLYAMNIHGRSPIARGTYASIDELTVYGTALADYGDADLAELITVDATSQSASYQMGYTEDVQIVGLSFATEIATMSVSGEVSHQKDIGLNVNDYLSIGAIISGELIVAGVMADSTLGLSSMQEAADFMTANSTAMAAEIGISESEVKYYAQQFGQNHDAETVDGFTLYDVSQVQLTAIKLFDQTLGADTVFAVVEGGYTFVHGLDDSGNATERYEGASEAIANTITQNSWGYRAIVGADYSNVIAGIDLSPELFYSLDVEGVAPLANSGFNEGNERLGLTLNATFNNNVSGSISYNRLNGGDNDRVSDRDFASVSVGMQF